MKRKGFLNTKESGESEKGTIKKDLVDVVDVISRPIKGMLKV